LFRPQTLRGLAPRRLGSPAYTLPRHSRRRLLVTLCHSHGVLPQSIFGKRHLATDRPNGYTGRQVRPPHRHGHQPKCCVRHRYGILFPIPYIHSVAMERAHIQQGKHIRYLLLPASTFEKFARWWLYTVPLSILAGVLIILAADITRVIICNMAFLDYSFARPLLFTSGLHTASSGFVLRMLLTTSLLGQAISTRSETGRTPLHRALGKCPILLLPLLLTIGVSLIAEGDPYTYPQQPGAATAEVVWHAFWLAVTSLFWLSAYRRMKKNDLKYQYALNPKSV